MIRIEAGTIVTPDGARAGAVEVAGEWIAALRGGRDNDGAGGVGGDGGTTGRQLGGQHLMLGVGRDRGSALPPAGAPSGRDVPAQPRLWREPASDPAPQSGAAVRLPAGYAIVPGFIDLHTHGAGGASLYSGEPEQVRHAAAVHLAHGTTGMLASISSMPLAQMCGAASAIADVIEAPDAPPNLLGIHLEGPFISPARRGAHEIGALLPPSLDAARALLDAGRGHVRSVTMAPELPGALDLTAWLRERGVLVSLGHTDATYEQALAGFDAGMTTVTHLCNAMAPLTHRAGGPILAALTRPDVACELINDGHHIAPAVARWLVSLLGPARLMLVTDAMAAAGAGDGRFLSGNRDVTVEGGVAQLTGTSTLAGSTLLFDRAVRRGVSVLGMELAEASLAASHVPGRVLAAGGLDDGGLARGRLVAGARADLVVLDEDLRVARVMCAGRWV